MRIKEAVEILKKEGCYNCAWGCDSPATCTCIDCDVRIAFNKAIDYIELRQNN